MRPDATEMAARAALERQLKNGGHDAVFPIEGEGLLLSSEQAAAYLEFRHAAVDLEGKHQAYKLAQERYHVALGKLSKTATGG